MKVRIAQRGIMGNHVAFQAGDVTVGIKLPWVELDGHRIDSHDGIIAARFVARDEALGLVTLELDVAGTVEVVYVDTDGEPLLVPPVVVAAERRSVLTGIEFDAATILRRSDLDP